MSDTGPETIPTGCIDLFGYHNEAGGWLFVGWIRSALMEPGEPFHVTAQFLDGVVTSQAVIAFYDRSDVRTFGVGVVAFILHDEPLHHDLEAFALDREGIIYKIPVPPSVRQLDSERINSFVRELLAGAELIGDSAPITSLVDSLGGGEVEEEQFTEPLPAEIAPLPEDIPEREPEFDEAAYLHEHPEVAEAIANGHLPNALFHYRLFSAGAGVRNAPRDRPPPLPQAPTPRPAAAAPAAAAHAPFGPCSVDVVMSSSGGAIFVIGWADDRQAPIQRISFGFEDGSTRELSGKALARFRRGDAEASLNVDQKLQLGFCGLLFNERQNRRAGQVQLVRVSAGEDSFSDFRVTPRSGSDIAMRDTILAYLSNVEFVGNKHVESFYALDGHLGQTLVRHNRAITRSITTAVTVERFETQQRRFKGSIIVCLYGKPEFQFVQNALFSTGPGADDYEYIYVSNSPELIEGLCKAATISRQIYGLSVTVAMLPGNAGFGAANNVAAECARSSRLMIVNPDVFPIAPDWAARHTGLVEGLPADRSRLFGPRLHYADGSLMHAGMYIDVDWGISVSGLEIRRRPMLRVEHYGKGAPKDTAQFRESRPVSAISGAFMSIDRSWFERLGGFAEEYIFGHYEDADLCLRSLEQGVLPWMHDLDFWHLEGKGSTRLPHHEGASLVNRWLFTREWHDRVVPKLIGRIVPASPAKVRVAS